MNLDRKEEMIHIEQQQESPGEPSRLGFNDTILTSVFNDGGG